MRHLVTAICILTIIIPLAFTGCTGEKLESKSMTQIYREEGVPVKVKTVEPTNFSTQLAYFAHLTGIRESTAFAPMGEKIEKIHVKVGDRVRKDQILVTFPTDAPGARFLQARVAYENARQAFERLDGLYKAGGISLQDRDNARARFDVAAADWDNVKQMVRVKAPISGTVTRVHVSETDNVKRETALVTIARTDRLKAEIWVSGNEINYISEGMDATATWQGQQVSGQVVQVDMAMNLRTRAFRALLEFDNNENHLKAGTTAEIKIITASRPEAIVVKRKNLLEDKKNGKHFVYVTNADTAHKRFVTLGRTQGLDVEITSGLNRGDQLVEEGQMLLQEGMKVKTISNVD